MRVGLLVLCVSGCAGASISPADSAAPFRNHDVNAPGGQGETLVEAGELGPAVLAERIVGTDRVIDEELASAPRERAASAGDISLNFENTPVAAVVQTILGELLRKNYAIAPGVGGTVSFATAKPVSSDQTLSILELLMAWNNAALLVEDGHYLVTPVANAVQGHLSPQVGPRQAVGYGVRAVPLRYVAASEMETWLQPFAREGSILRADNSRQLLIVAGNSQELTNYLRIIETLDIDILAGMSMGVFYLEHANAKAVVADLEAVLGDQQAPIAGMLRLLPIERLNALLVITPRKHYLAEAERWIQRFDRAGAEGRAQLYVYPVRNVRALDLADRLKEIFTGQSMPRRERSDRGRLARGLSGTQLASAGDAPVDEPPPAPEPSTPDSPSGSSGGMFDPQEARITAIEDSNSLLIQADPAVYDLIKRAIDRLDVQPRQVLIEAKVLEVTLSNNLRFGVEWYLENGIAQAPGLIRPAASGSGSSSAGATRDPDRRVWGSMGGIVTQAGAIYQFDGPDVRALVNLLQSESDVQVLSSPSILVLNNRQAQINVGQQIPIQIGGIGSLGDGISNPGSGLINQQFTQYRDTGVTLSVTPRVNPGGLVYLEIEQEQSTPGNTPAGGGNPPINRKLISTEVAIQSGQTVMLGGLIQQVEDNSSAGVPGLKNIPVVGRLLGASARLADRTETIVLITPTIIEGAEVIEKTEDYLQGLQGLESLLRAERNRPM
ncbi:MAG: type II secretion system secretin GspD [Xanthomonadales bacterium]|jgi:general secretion pathway protein D|nr:type II secretion system secretin GspD [Xanthomonadales bacterium]